MMPMAVRTSVEGSYRHTPSIERRHAEDSFPDIQRPVPEGICYIKPETDL